MTYYREVQKMPAWIWWLLLPVTLVMAYGAFQQLILKRPFGDNPMPDGWMLIIWAIFGLGLPLFFLFLELRTEVRDDGVHARFYPLPSFGGIEFKQIQRSYVRTFRPIVEYGGWGLRFSRNGTAYIMKGTEGVQFELEDDKRVLIGSQNSAAFQQAVEQASSAARV